MAVMLCHPFDLTTVLSRHWHCVVHGKITFCAYHHCTIIAPHHLFSPMSWWWQSNAMYILLYHVEIIPTSPCAQHSSHTILCYIYIICNMFSTIQSRISQKILLKRTQTFSWHFLESIRKTGFLDFFSTCFQHAFFENMLRFHPSHVQKILRTQDISLKIRKVREWNVICISRIFWEFMSCYCSNELACGPRWRHWQWAGLF